MALINKIREKTGLAVGVIAFGLILFLVGGDLLGPNSVILGQNNTVVGEIAGEEIDYQDFIAKVEEYSGYYARQTGTNPSSEQLVSIRQQVWDDLVNEISFRKQFDALGLTISDSELEEMVRGNNISPLIRQNFTDPQTGQFNKEDVVNFLRQYSQMPPQQQAAWNRLQEQLGPNRMATKFENLFLNANFVTTAEAKQDYNAKNSTASVSYLYVPFFSVKDSTISIDDSELRSYIGNNSDDFEAEATRDISYVTFEVKASAADTALVKEEIELLKEDLATSDNDSLFALRNSDAFTPFKSYRMDELPTEISNLDNIETGSIHGPIQLGSRFVMYKISDRGERDKYSAKANHILFTANEGTASAEERREARTEARRVLKEIRDGADFASMARIYGTDGTAQRGGDLGWFAEGDMVGPFNDAVMAATRTGLLNDVVETEFGYHIIEVTETKTREYFKVAQIEKEIYPSDETINEFYRTADIFATKSTSLDEFNANAEADGLKVEDRKRIGKNDRVVNRLTNARDLVFWAFNKAEVGDVSEVYDLEDKYVVAVVTGAQDEGTADLESVRNEVERKVINKKKAESIEAKLAGLSGSLEEMATAYGEDAKIYTMENLNLSANSLSNVGIAPEAIGMAFALEAGERTGTIVLDNGVIILQLDGITNANELDDYTPSKDQLAQSRAIRIRQNINNAIKEFADVEDNRYKFF